MEHRTAPTGPGGLDHLLRPSLQAAAHRPLYSVRAGFLVAFFGGVYATLGFSALNSRRASRLPKDAWFYALATIVWSAVLIAVGHGLATESLPTWLDIAGSPQRTVRWGGRLVALALFGLVCLRHRPLIKAQELFGADPPNPWLAGILNAVISMALSILFLGIGFALARS